MSANSARRRRALDDAAGIHHRHLVGAAGDDAEIVGDQDHRHVPALLLARQQVEDLRLHRDVERRGRLVGDQQLGLAGERDGDRHALAHAAGELVRDTGAAAAPARGCRPRPAARRRAASLRRCPMPRWACSVSMICVPMVSTGLSEVIGSWKTTASSGPRSRRSASGGRRREIAAVEHHPAAQPARAWAAAAGWRATAWSCRSPIRRPRPACGRPPG